MLQASLRPKAATVSKKITFFLYKGLCHQIRPWRKICQGQPRVVIWKTLVVLALPMLHTKFLRSSFYWFWGRIIKTFYHIWAWQPCWSCDPTHLYKFSFLFSLKLSYEIWFQIAQLFMRKTSFNFEIWMTFDQGQRMTLTFDTHSRSLTHLAKCFKQVWDLRLQ